MNNNNNELIAKAMGTIRRILFNQGNVIGLNQINGVAKMNGLSFTILKKETDKIEDIQIVKAYEPPR